MEKEINSLGSVHVDKNQLLDIVKGNKEKHDIIYNAALSGYNVAVGVYLGRVLSETERINNLAKEYAKLETFGARFDKTGLYLVDCNLPSVPVSYAHEYDKTIRKLELATADKITLQDSEFESYVLNNWKWKENFLVSNTSYLRDSIMVSGALSSFNQ
jgi:hypothetical protein